jgi:hypothetical protein
MSASVALAPPRLLQDVDRRGDGNRLLLYEIDGAPALLKHYPSRGARSREWIKAFWYRVGERKLGISARERCGLERMQLALWRRHGFDVPALLPHPLPTGFDAETASWLEYCPGPTLLAVVADAARPQPERAALLARFGAVLAARQARVLVTRELQLVMKHASLKHVLVHGERLVHFDLESAHAPGVDVRDALADELSGLVRSLLRGAKKNEDGEALGIALLAGHGRPDVLREILARGLGGHVTRRLRRFADRRRRPGFAKHDALEWVQERI